MPAFKGNFIEIKESDFQETVRFFNEAAEAFGDRWLKDTQARRAKKHFVPEMKDNIMRAWGSLRLTRMVSVTTSRKYTGSPRAIRVGVVKNDASLFPKFSAQAMASVLEHGVEERFRETGIFSSESTGSISAMPALRPAYDVNVGPFMQDVERSIEKKFDKET